MKKIALCLLFMLSCAVTFSQNVLNIPFGGSITLGKVNDKTQFTISSAFGKIHVKGQQINTYTFDKPGNYKIKVAEYVPKNVASCEAHILPKEITVKVSRIKMIFDQQNLAFSEPIRKNVSTENIIMSIPVTVTTYDHLSIQLGNAPVNSAGIGTTIVAYPFLKENILSEGTHVLKYTLTGLVNLNSNLMFDFIDANNQVQSISLPTQVKN